MTELSFLAGEALFAAFWLLLRAAVWLRQRRIDWKREALLLLMYINLAVILRFVLYPMAMADGRVQPLLLDPAAALHPRINLIPLVKLTAVRSKKFMLMNILGNVSLFLPTGFILPILYRRLDSFWKVTAIGALMSLGVELLQLLFRARITDIDDLILNTLGVMIGYGVYVLARRLAAKRN